MLLSDSAILLTLSNSMAESLPPISNYQKTHILHLLLSIYLLPGVIYIP